MKASDWISVNDKLPEIEETVLGYFELGTSYKVEETRIECILLTRTGKSPQWTLCEPSFWMPIVPPAKN